MNFPKSRFKSKVGNHFDFLSWVKTILANATCSVCKFIGQYSPQNLWLSSIFIGNVTLHAYLKVLGFIVLNATNTSIYFFTSASSQNESWLGVVLHGGNPWVLTICFPNLERPNSPLCQTKMFRNYSSSSHNWLNFSWPRSWSILILSLISTHMSCPSNGTLDVTLLGVCTLWWPYMDVTMIIFLVFLIYKKINKIKFIEIMKKRFIYLKLS